MDVQADIAVYFDHISDMDYLEKVLVSASLDSIFDSLVVMLTTRRGELADIACLFIRDVVLLAPKHVGGAFSEKIHTSPVIGALEANLFSEDFNNRYNAVYTLGKIGSTSSSPLLHKAFDHFKERDPLMLPRLIFELNWLGSKETSRLLGETIQSRRYLTRWSALSRTNLEQLVLLTESFDLLRHDENALVRAEAEFHHHEQGYVEQVKALAALPRADKNARRKVLKEALEKHKPALLFGVIEIQFLNHLSKHQRRTFHLDDLGKYVEALANPSREEMGRA